MVLRARGSLCAVVLTVALAACAGAATKEATPTTATVATTTTVAPSRPFSVTRRDVTVEDSSRTTNALADHNLAAEPSRTLPIMLLVPDGPGPFPLVFQCRPAFAFVQVFVKVPASAVDPRLANLFALQIGLTDR